MKCPCGNHAACVPGCALMDYPGYTVYWGEPDPMPIASATARQAAKCMERVETEKFTPLDTPFWRHISGVEDDGFRTAYPEAPYSPPLPDVTRDNPEKMASLHASDATWTPDPLPDVTRSYTHPGMIVRQVPLEDVRGTDWLAADEAAFEKMAADIRASDDCAPVASLVDEIDEWYADNDPLMAGAGDGNSPPWTEKTLLDDILEQRGSRYGRFADNADISQVIKGAFRGGLAILRMAPDQIEALEQIAAKISRIVTGDPDYVDNWDDIAGYAKLVADRLREEQK